MSELRRDCENELEFHLKKAGRSLCPRRRDCDIWFGGKNGSSMISKLVINLQNLRSNCINVEWQLYDSILEEPLVIVSVTPLMERVHRMVIIFLH